MSRAACGTVEQVNSPGIADDLGRDDRNLAFHRSTADGKKKCVSAATLLLSTEKIRL